VILERLFSRSSELVCILTGDLTPQVYGQEFVLDAIAAFLGRGRLEILTERPLEKDHPLLARAHLAGLQGQIQVTLVPQDVTSRYGYHFAVGDGQHYRFEPDRANFEAIVQFGNASPGEALVDAFRELQQACSQL
jgi:hypothetical protein